MTNLSAPVFHSTQWKVLHLPIAWAVGKVKFLMSKLTRDIQGDISLGAVVYAAGCASPSARSTAIGQVDPAPAAVNIQRPQLSLLGIHFWIGSSWPIAMTENG